MSYSDNGNSQHISLTPFEQHVKTHAILCSTGFLILLPIGVLIARLTRTFTANWFYAHEVFQLVLAAPVIGTGWYFGHKVADELGSYDSPHRKIGKTLLILYVGQLVLGLIIHHFKTRGLFGSRRPPQNYFHAVLGLCILSLAAYQVHHGYDIEWPSTTGNPVPKYAAIAWLVVLIIFWALYSAGLALLPRQFKQESNPPVSNADGQKDQD